MTDPLSAQSSNVEFWLIYPNEMVETDGAPEDSVRMTVLGPTVAVIREVIPAEAYRAVLRENEVLRTLLDVHGVASDEERQ